jgi:hypothetical protein
MPRAVELPTGDPPRSGPSQGVYDRKSRRRVRKIDFDEGALRDIENPAARVAALKNKYLALGR